MKFLILLIACCILLCAQNPPPEPPAHKPISELHDTKLDLFLERKEKLERYYGDLLKEICTAAGFKQEDCLFDPQMRRVMSRAELAKQQAKAADAQAVKLPKPEAETVKTGGNGPPKKDSPPAAKN